MKRKWHPPALRDLARRFMRRGDRMRRFGVFFGAHDDPLCREHMNRTKRLATIRRLGALRRVEEIIASIDWENGEEGRRAFVHAHRCIVNYHLQRTWSEPRDMVNAFIASCLSGARHFLCPSGKRFVRFLYFTMTSMAENERRRLARRPEQPLVEE